MKKANIFHIISCAIIIIGAICIFLNYIDGSNAGFEAQLNETLITIASAAGLIYMSRFIAFAFQENAKEKSKKQR